jgi:hypothetical protein
VFRAEPLDAIAERRCKRAWKQAPCPECGETILLQTRDNSPERIFLYTGRHPQTMAMSLKELVTWLKEMNRKQAELISLPVVYTVVWMGFIGPTIGDTTGLDTPAVVWAISRPTFTLGVRTFLLFSGFIVFCLVYIYGKPRLFGDDPAEYWEMRSHKQQEK